MPTYSYVCDFCGYATEDFKPMAEQNAPMSCNGCGKQMRRDVAAEVAGVRSHYPGTYPMESEAMGVHPDQAVEASAYMESVGVPTEFTADGAAVLTSKEHRRKHAEARGFFDRNGGYSDPQRK